MFVGEYMLFYRISLLLAALILAAAFAEPAWAEGHGRRHSWLESLSVEQRQTVERIMTEARPRILELRDGVRQKMAELQAFSYRNDGDSEELSRIGRELQGLRDKLRQALQALDERLVEEAGLAPMPHRGRSCSTLNSRLPQAESEARAQ